eukprot:TRINITY_DN3583_c0_g3_i1.p1 TRINITY_DN3583_c0_g3~~TRINITY_DN3583_c0_g3_i1.p1  ORF type:complete len:269 (+),score=36.30 TRINITY_DN3583_c0_g3_i1:82-888(+)
MSGGGQTAGETPDATLRHRSSSSTDIEVPGQIYFRDQLMVPGPVTTLQRRQNRHWHLVWCHEHCFKPDAAGQCRMLQGVALEGGGSLVCHKKAARFLEWLANNRTPYVLLSDWREAKPCLEGLERHAGAFRGQPLVTCVYTETAQIYERAHMWARGLPSNEVTVFSELSVEPLKEFLTSHCSISFQEAPEVVLTNSTAPAVWLSQGQPRPHGTASDHVVSQRSRMDAQSVASRETAVAEMRNVQRLSVSEVIRLLQEGRLQSDAVVSV